MSKHRATITCSKCRNRIEISDLLDADLRLLCDQFADENERLRKMMQAGCDTVKACGHGKHCGCCWCDLRRQWAAAAAGGE